MKRQRDPASVSGCIGAVGAWVVILAIVLGVPWLAEIVSRLLDAPRPGGAVTVYMEVLTLVGTVWLLLTYAASGASGSGGTGRSWTLTFEGHPPSPNDRLKLRDQMHLRRAWRSEAAVRARLAGIPTLARARITLTVVRPRVGAADPDNDQARAIPLVNGCRDAGVLPDDTYAHVEYGQVREERGPAGVRLLIEEVPGE